MTSITLFTAPKPFTEPRIATIQRNAIRSWALLPEVEVILLGKEAGLAEAAHELGVRHIPNVACNPRGTPLISSMFRLAREGSRSDLLCIINADIILMPDFIEAVTASKRLLLEKGCRAFVLLGRRWDLDVAQPIEFVEGWQARLQSIVRSQGQLHRPAGSDFFVFPRSCYMDVPPFAIGRAGWDNWMIYKARREKWPVIDITPSVMVIHQNHDYRHLPAGQSHHTVPETEENIRLAGGPAVVRYTVLDSTRQLMGGKLVRPKCTRSRLARKVELLLRALFFFLPEKKIEELARPKRWKKRFERFFERITGRSDPNT